MAQTAQVATIQKILTAPGLAGFYFDDQRAIKAGARQDGFAYVGEPMTPGFTRIRQAGEALSVLILMSDGQVAYGDCAAVQYSGAGGREPLFHAPALQALIEEQVAPRLEGQPLESFRALAAQLDAMRRADGSALPLALRYGVTQALLSAVALAHKEAMAETIVREYGLPWQIRPVPIFCQTGDDRYLNADKIILKRADVLPHGLINNVEEKLGRRGEKLRDYVAWLRRRIQTLGGPDYHPTLHIDVYGTLGLAFQDDLAAITEYLADLAQVAAPFPLRIEGPVDMGDRGRQMEALAALRRRLDAQGVPVQIVADEWCNTLEDIRTFVDAQAGHMVQIKTPDLGGVQDIIEAVLYCKGHGMGAYLGGTCNETDRSAQVSVHVAIATQPDQMLAKPGMGVDEGLSIVYNEMQRTLALLRHRHG